MILISAPGSPSLQSALKNDNVQKIVVILLQIIKRDSVLEQGFFRRVARFLKRFDQHALPHFEKELQTLRLYHQRSADNTGEYTLPSYADELLCALEMLYEQPQNTLNYQRGAIVELFSSELVCSRCKSRECFGNQIFVHRASRYQSDQVDVVVFSEIWQQLEGYTCKINPDTLSSPDCTNLSALSNKAQELGFLSHVGVICFEDSHIIMQRIRRIPHITGLHAYGTDNIRQLEKSPF